MQLVIGIVYGIGFITLKPVNMAMLKRWFCVEKFGFVKIVGIIMAWPWYFNCKPYDIIRQNREVMGKWGIMDKPSTILWGYWRYNADITSKIIRDKQQLMRRVLFGATYGIESHTCLFQGFCKYIWRGVLSKKYKGTNWEVKETCDFSHLTNRMTEWIFGWCFNIRTNNSVQEVHWFYEENWRLTKTQLQ